MKPFGKPIYGSPCTGCGACCIAEQCPISVRAFGECDICPALELHGTRYACGLISSPLLYVEKPEEAAELANAAGNALGIGRGCDSIVTILDRLEENRIGPFYMREDRAA